MMNSRVVQEKHYAVRQSRKRVAKCFSINSATSQGPVEYADRADTKVSMKETVLLLG